MPYCVCAVLSGPPQAVSVVQLTNSSSISVSWEPPAVDAQSGIVREYKVRPPSLAPTLHFCYFNIHSQVCAFLGGFKGVNYANPTI